MALSPSLEYFRSGYQQKDRKPSQNDKTEHGMEKTVQNQGQSIRSGSVLGLLYKCMLIRLSDSCAEGKQHKASCKDKLVTQSANTHTNVDNWTYLGQHLCDNRTEFKNNDMNRFYGMKGVKMEFSVARTLQQNGVVERKNMTLIEAARTMLAALLLPTTFWAEEVNTAWYVQNRVLVTKPHNKTLMKKTYTG
ncbi:ribonuclease H-like domain-containing protein [Tanacetum coccineum]